MNDLSTISKALLVSASALVFSPNLAADTGAVERDVKRVPPPSITTMDHINRIKEYNYQETQLECLELRGIYDKATSMINQLEAKFDLEADKAGITGSDEELNYLTGAISKHLPDLQDWQHYAVELTRLNGFKAEKLEGDVGVCSGNDMPVSQWQLTPHK